MSVRFRILGSGSSGNCAFLQTENCRVLVDAGFSARRIAEMLEEAGESFDRIDAIFLTHEHGDHSRALTGLARRRGIQVFANEGTARAVQENLRYRPEWQLFRTGSSFSFRDLRVDAFSVPHDAFDPVGFVFSVGEDDLFSRRRSIAWATDLGHAPGHVRERVRDVDLLVIEANHDWEMLQSDSRRPWPVKQRIGGRHGHLSNEGAFALLESVDAPRWSHVFLAHLSRDCNSTEAVRRAFSPYLDRKSGFELSIVEPGRGTDFFQFS